MSRGLGRLQREILDTLDEAKASIDRYHGGGRQGAGWVRANFREWKLPDDTYDLRASLRYLAARHGKVHRAGSVGCCNTGYVDGAFQASFSRAARSLVDRGELVRAKHYSIYNSTKQQTRFVQRPQCFNDIDVA
jgi:dienelactone hydrolase